VGITAIHLETVLVSVPFAASTRALVVDFVVRSVTPTTCPTIGAMEMMIVIAILYVEFVYKHVEAHVTTNQSVDQNANNVFLANVKTPAVVRNVLRILLIVLLVCAEEEFFPNLVVVKSAIQTTNVLRIPKMAVQNVFVMNAQKVGVVLFVTGSLIVLDKETALNAMEDSMAVLDFVLRNAVDLA